MRVEISRRRDVRFWPKGYVLDYTGDSRQLRTEGINFSRLLRSAVVLIFLVLAAQFNSFRDPFIILLGSVPLPCFGAWLFTSEVPNRRRQLHFLPRASARASRIMNGSRKAVELRAARTEKDQYDCEARESVRQVRS